MAQGYLKGGKKEVKGQAVSKGTRRNRYGAITTERDAGVLRGAEFGSEDAQRRAILIEESSLEALNH